MKIMIAGGGTGGHLFPALAVAEAFRERDPGNEILFVGSGRGLETSVLGKEGVARRSIAAVSLQDKSFWGKALGLAAIPKSLGQSACLLRSFRPDMVLGVGGYASGPVVLMGWALGYKTAIHEQNAFPGFSNRVLGRFVDRIFISFADSGIHFPRKKTVLTGNPVRRKMRSEERDVPGPGGPQFTLLIFGGSQGAHRLNVAMGESLGHLREKIGKWQIIHQTGERDYGEVKEAYAREGWAAEVHPFIHDMERVYTLADLVLCRAGATTIFELMAMGKPAVLVPYPYAANDHQTLNAQALVKAGAALMIKNDDLTGSRLSAMLVELSQDPARLTAMGEAAAALAKPQAAREIVNLCYQMVNHESSSE
jgi:UDP-N-acetylglucosamine--N-acetylmuramyl-(pentapeptide) pyrophosphoryl-undecaprenol N-acetylglucosamine transferase